MKYVGSKSRIAKHILPIILSNRHKNQLYVEPFCGGCNSLQFVTGKRLANDGHKPLIAMWRELLNGWKPRMYSKEDYCEIRDNKEAFPLHEVGWVGFNLSYCGKYFGGFAGVTKTDQGVRDYQREAINNINKQLPLLNDVEFENCTFFNFYPPDGSIVYCDPPYKDTTSYSIPFDHEQFWIWADKLSKRCEVFVSEYSCPIKHKLCYEAKVLSSLSANGYIGGSKVSNEKLFKIG